MILELCSTLIPLLAALTAGQEVADPCTSYITLNGGERNQHRDTNPNETLMCDKDLAHGWYRFIDAEVATSNVGKGRCGTESTIWMNDTVPNIGHVVYRKFCFNHLDVSPTGCLWSEQVPVKNCGGFMVYQFPLKTILCPMAVCTDSFPNITGDPTLSAPEETVDGGFRHVCTFTSPGTSSFVRFNTTWSMDGVPISHEILSGTERHAYFDLDQWRGHINKQLTCGVRSYFQTSNATRSPEYTSNAYYGGLQVEPQPVRLVEGVDTTIEIISTLPINCRGQVRPELCQVELSVVAPDLSTLGNCNLTLTPAEWNSSTNETRIPLNVTPRQDLIFKPDQETFLSFEVSSNLNPGMGIWENANMSRFMVFTQDTEFVSCFGFGDPHFTESFNTGLRESYNLYHIGDFRFASDARVPIAVQISTNVFSPEDLPVISAVAVQTGSDVTIIDTMSGSAAPVVTSIRHPTSHTVQSCGTNEYQISTPTGHRINVFHRYQIPGGHYIDVRATFPAGVIPIDVGNDTVSNNTYNVTGRVHEVCNIEPTTEGQPTLGNYVEISSNVIDYFRVRPEDSLFKGNTLTLETASPRRYCTCLSGSGEGGQCSAGSEVSDPYVSRQTCRPLKTTIRTKTTNQTDQREHGYSGEYRLIPRSWPTSTGINEEDARTRCLNAIRNYTSPQCSTVNINISNFIDGCADDVQASGSFGYLPAAVQAFQSSCETALLNNATNFNDTAENIFGIVKLVTDQCPNLCSMHGACVDGRCQCDPGWEWDDCSVRSGNPFRVTGVRGGNICDASISDDCFNPTLVVENLGQTAACAVEPIEYDRGQPVVPKDSYTVDSFRATRFGVSCNIATSVASQEIHARAFNISLVTDSGASNDLQTIRYLVYDGVCQKCDDDFICYQKQDACLIGGRCYRAGEVNVASDYMQVCNPETDLDGWTDLLNTFPITVRRK